MWILNLSIKLPQWAHRPQKPWLSRHSQGTVKGKTSMPQNFSNWSCTSLKWLPSGIKNRAGRSDLTILRLLAARNSQLRKAFLFKEVNTDLGHALWSWQTSRARQLANKVIRKSVAISQTIKTSWMHMRWCKVLDKETKTLHNWKIRSTMESSFCFVCTPQVRRGQKRMHPPHTLQGEIRHLTWLGIGAHMFRIYMETHTKKKGTPYIVGINGTKRIVLFQSHLSLG